MEGESDESIENQEENVVQVFQDDYDSEEEEPLLKYLRMEGTVSSIFEVDSATAFASSDRIVVLGTERGHLHVLDVNGDEIRLFRPHTQRINQVSINLANTHVASASEDGTVVIIDLWEQSKDTFKLSKPVKALALHPRYPQKDFKVFACGTEKELTIHSLNYFGRRKSRIPGGNDSISAICWHVDTLLLSFATSEGVKVFDIFSQTAVTFIVRPQSSQEVLCNCNIFWRSRSILVVGWGNTVQILRLSASDPLSPQHARNTNSAGSVKIQEISFLARFELENMLIAGLAPFHENMVVLGLPPNTSQDDETWVRHPELLVVSEDGEIISSDSLPIRGFKDNQSHQYSLAYHYTRFAQQDSSEDFYYLVFPKDVVVAKPYGVDDHVRYLLDRGLFREAWMHSVEHSVELKEMKTYQVAEQYLTYLCLRKQFAAAADLCPDMFRGHPELWEKWIHEFSKEQQSPAIVEYIPTSHPKLSQSTYTLVLYDLLQQNPQIFLATVQRWPKTLYNVSEMIQKTLHRITLTDSTDLRKALAELYLFNKQFVGALETYSRLGDPIVFQLISQHQLFEYTQDKVLNLMQLNPSEAAQLFLTHRNILPVDSVTRQLEPYPALLHVYLDALFQDTPALTTPFHHRMVSLYATYQPEHLLAFLKQSNHYILESALETCEKHQLYREMVFLLGRTGDTLRALELIVVKLRDFAEAIRFVEEHQDIRLWSQLVEMGLKYPEFVSGLLEHVGGNSFVDARLLINRIPDHMDIPNLRDKLLRIVSDYSLEVRLRLVTQRILRSDCVSLLQRLNAEVKRAMEVAPGEQQCSVCRNMLGHGKAEEELVVFYCGHCYHSQCVGDQPSCSVCKAGHKGRHIRRPAVRQ